MKKIVFFLVLLLVSSGFSEESKKKTICLNMIVKNEKDVITRCLASVLPFIDSWVIVDTGSTDGTQEIIKEFMKAIPGELYERPWIDFGYNRNEALSFAQNKADYILFMDADDYLSYPLNYMFPQLTKDCYAFIAYNQELKCFWPRLINARLEWEWQGAIHEQIIGKQSMTSEVLKEIEYVYVHDGARAKDPDTYKKDAAILEKAILRNPKESRNFFYLAMSYLRLGNLDKGLEMHEKRAEMQGVQEETFVSKLSIPILQTALKKDLRIIKENFFKAYIYRPHRAETFYYLIEALEKEKDYEIAYQVSALALSLPFNSNDSLFVEQWIYDFGLLVKYAFCAQQTNRFLESLEACQKLLSRSDIPENIRREMQEFYEKATQKKQSLL